MPLDLNDLLLSLAYSSEPGICLGSYPAYRDRHFESNVLMRFDPLPFWPGAWESGFRTAGGCLETMREASADLFWPLALFLTDHQMIQIE